jgi:hypothetical protein
MLILSRQVSKNVKKTTMMSREKSLAIVKQAWLPLRTWRLDQAPEFQKGFSS